MLNTIHENYEYIPIRASYILQLHRDLYKYSGKTIGGRFKNTQNFVAETHSDGTQFVKYILGAVLSAYRDFENRVSLVDEKLPAIELVRNATTEKIGKFTKSEIMELVPSVGKASVENSLKKLVDEGFLTRHGKGKGIFYTRN